MAFLDSNKRPATAGGEEDDGAKKPALEISGLPEICRIHVLNYLGEEDLVTMTLVSKDFHWDCHHTGIEKKIMPIFQVVAGGPRPGRKLLEVLCAARSKSRFSNYRHLHISGANHYDLVSTKDAKEIMKQALLEGIVSLDLSLPAQKEVGPYIPTSLSGILPNLLEVNLSNVVATRKREETVLRGFAKNCPLLEKVTWHGSQENVFLLTGRDLQEADGNLKELYLDEVFINSGGRIKMRIAHGMTMPYHEDYPISGFYFLFYHCSQKLERVSIRNAAFSALGMSSLVQPIPQEALIKFVRQAPALRWFRSDLSAANIAMLQAERPGIELLN